MRVFAAPVVVAMAALAIATPASSGQAAATQAGNVDHIEIVDYGIYTEHVINDVPQSDSLSGTQHIVDNIVLRRQTTAIPAELGLNFGMHFKVVGSPDGALAPLRIVTIFPGVGLTNPDTGQTRYSSSSDTQVKVGSTSFHGYGFDHPWERVPGVWTFQVWSGERLLASQSFTIALP